jgi:hypothetical protein
VKEFLRESWIYLAAPIVIVTIGAIVMVMVSNSASSLGVYEIF